MNRYGQSITWGTAAAPTLFTGAVTSYSYRDARTRQLIPDTNSDNAAFVLHSQKADLNFEARITTGSTDFLDLSAGAKIAVSGLSGGTILARRAREVWRLMQPKTAAVQATHYPDMTGGSGASAGATANAFTPTQTLPAGLLTPGSSLIYSTVGLTHANGVVHGLTIEQILEISEDEPSPDGKILGAASHAYMRTIELDLLATGARPASGTTLVVGGAPSNGTGFTIETADEVWANARGKMYHCTALWIG